MSDTAAGGLGAVQPSSSPLDTAYRAAQDGAADARQAAANALPAAGRALSKGAYHTGFGLSFGITFPIFLLARVIPKNNPVVHGFVDGAHAAVDLVHESKRGAATASQPAST